MGGVSAGLHPAVFANRVVANDRPQPDAFDGGIEGGNGQREQRADHSGELAADDERDDDREIRQLQAPAIRPRRNQVVLDGVVTTCAPMTSSAVVGETVSASSVAGIAGMIEPTTGITSKRPVINAR